MARNRKANSQKAEKDATSSSTEASEIPEDEQWRLVNESGILGKMASIPRANEEEVQEPELTPLGEEIFNSIILIIPMSFVLLLMEILIHFQYGKRPTFEAVLDRMVPGVPILSISIFYTTRYKSLHTMQAFLFVLAVFAGSRLIYLMNLGSWLVNMRQCPPLATMWVYATLQLNLAPAVVSLGVVGAYVWWRGLDIIL
ncbi:hypothetical protein Hypma_010291 [Hypsizygus marmoreus]|uniref:DUF7719 domain-containing protein n=1 Tax=Hypsizygus marmoreus TaxID=39966 RepID=A0A369JVA1_HYPMA|nr:hypothetical protein Hypma_010291 [Hypsizygus marmoreus]